jgi:hypothetical protein
MATHLDRRAPAADAISAPLRPLTDAEIDAAFILGLTANDPDAKLSSWVATSFWSGFLGCLAWYESQLLDRLTAFVRVALGDDSSRVATAAADARDALVSFVSHAQGQFPSHRVLAEALYILSRKELVEKMVARDLASELRGGIRVQQQLLNREESLAPVQFLQGSTLACCLLAALWGQSAKSVDELVVRVPNSIAEPRPHVGAYSRHAEIERVLQQLVELGLVQVTREDLEDDICIRYALAAKGQRLLHQRTTAEFGAGAAPTSWLEPADVPSELRPLATSLGQRLRRFLFDRGSEPR